MFFVIDFNRSCGHTYKRKDKVITKCCFVPKNKFSTYTIKHTINQPRNYLRICLQHDVLELISMQTDCFSIIERSCPSCNKKNVCGKLAILQRSRVIWKAFWCKILWGLRGMDRFFPLTWKFEDNANTKMSRTLDSRRFFGMRWRLHKDVFFLYQPWFKRHYWQT